MFCDLIFILSIYLKKIIECPFMFLICIYWLIPMFVLCAMWYIVIVEILYRVNVLL